MADITVDNSATAPLEGLRHEVFEEIRRRTQETDLSVPYRLGGWWYYSRTEQGKQYPIMCRKRGSLDAQEEIALDLNQLARDDTVALMAPVIETRVRIPGGDAVQRVWCVPDAGGLVVVEITNDSTLPIAVAFDSPDVLCDRTPSPLGPQGIELPKGQA